MKRTIFTLSLLLAITVLCDSLSAAIRRVNNNTGVTGVYATLQSAYDASSAGDTLLIEGSNTNYGDLTIAQKLVIFGTGYQLANNPQTQSNLISSKLGNLTYNVGADGSVVMGCTINSIIINENNITIARNYIANSAPTTASITLNGNNTGIVIKQNAVWGLITNTPNKTPSVMIKNNLLGRVVFTETIDAAMIINNTFWYSYAVWGNGTYAIDVYKSTVSSNIIWCYDSRGSLYFDSNQGNTIEYNYMNQANPGAYSGTNNLFAQSIPFTGDGNYYSLSDNVFSVTAGSAAETAAQGGGQCGMFGGTDPYVLSGMPPIPHIYKLESDPAGTNTDPLNVKISVKAQN